MSEYIPPFPTPHRKKSSALLYLIRGLRSWIHASFERSYSMKMGQVWTPRNTIYILNEPVLWKRVMIEQWERFPKHHMLWSQLRPLLGDSIFTTNGETWKQQRRMIDPAFQTARMKVVLPMMQAAVNDMAERFEEYAKSTSPVDVEVEMTHVTADIIFRTIMSSPISAEEANAIFVAFNKYQEKALKGVTLKVFKLPYKFMERKANQFAKEIRTIIADKIRPRYDAYHSGNPGDEQDILAVLLAEVDEQTGHRFSYEEMVDHICMLFLAGHETSASSLSWALYIIANTHDVQQRMRDEVAQVIGERNVEFGEMKKMRLVYNVFRETLRLYPPVGYFVRESTQVEHMRDKTIKKGCPILISPWLIQRHRELWARPDTFDPDRFDDPETKQSQNDAYLPFGAGPRVCIGAAFATQEAILILSNLVRRFRFDAIANDVPEPVGRVTIRSAKGIRLRVSRAPAADHAKS